jgi:hypothetical protein
MCESVQVKSVEAETEPPCALRLSFVGAANREPCRRSLGNDFYRLTSFGSVARTLNNDPNSHVRIPGNYPGRHVGKMLHALRQQFRLDVTGPWNIGENLRFCRPGNPISPTDLGLRCPCLITLRHVVLHRVEWSNFGPCFCTYAIIRLHSRFRIKRGQSLPIGRASKKITDWTALYLMPGAASRKRAISSGLKISGALRGSCMVDRCLLRSGRSCVILKKNRSAATVALIFRVPAPLDVRCN